jgi:hypothetical protein
MNDCTILVQGKNGLKTYLGNFVCYPDRSWKDAREGIITDIEVVKTVTKTTGEIRFIRGRMLDSEPITEDDLSSLVWWDSTRRFHISDKYILSQVGSSVDVFVKLNGHLFKINELCYSLCNLLIKSRQFESDLLDNEYKIDTHEKAIEAAIHCLNSLDSYYFSAVVSNFKFDIYDNKYILVTFTPKYREERKFTFDSSKEQKRLYIYNRMTMDTKYTYTIMSTVLVNSKITDTIKQKELLEYMKKNKIFRSNAGSSSCTPSVHIVDSDNEDFYILESSFISSTFRAEYLEQEDFVDSVNSSYDDYYKFCEKIKKNMTAKSIQKYKDCFAIYKER